MWRNHRYWSERDRYSPRTRDRERAEWEKYYERVGKQITVNFQNASNFAPSKELAMDHFRKYTQ